MKLKLILSLSLVAAFVLALAPAVAFADPRVDPMYRRCAEVMAQGSCAGLQPIEAYTPAQQAAPVLLIGIGQVTWRDFVAVRGSGSVDPNDLRMCEVAAAACRGDWNSPRCMVGRYLWGGRK